MELNVLPVFLGAGALSRDPGQWWGGGGGGGGSPCPGAPSGQSFLVPAPAEPGCHVGPGRAGLSGTGGFNV